MSTLPEDQAQTAPIRVLIGDAQLLFAEALVHALGGLSHLDVIEHCPTTGTDAVRSVVQHRPDVAILDYWFPDMDGAAVVRAIRRQSPGVKVLILSWLHGTAQVNAALIAGAAGYLPKNLRLRQLADAVQRAADGESPVYAREVARLVTEISRKAELAEDIAARLASLTTREIEILRLLNDGLSVKQAAQELGITVGTVKNHLHKMLGKTNTSSQAEILAMARRGKVLIDASLPPHSPHSGPHWVG